MNYSNTIMYIFKHLLIFTVQSKVQIWKAQLSVSLSNKGDTKYKHLPQELGHDYFVFELIRYGNKYKKIKGCTFVKQNKSHVQISVFSQHFEIKDVPCYIAKTKIKCYKMLKDTVFHKKKNDQAF